MVRAMSKRKKALFRLDADLLTLRTIVAVVDEGSFSAAANQVGRSQSAVSLQIAKLEEQIDVRLFERTSRTVKQTPAGEVFIAYARRIIELADEALAAVRVPETSKPFRIGFAEYLVPQHLHKLFSRFKRRYPKANIELRLGVGGVLVQALNRDELDLVIAGPEGEKGQMLFEEPLVWVGPQNSGLEAGGEGLELIMMQPPCSYRKAAFDSLAKSEVTWQMGHTANSIQAVQSAISAGLGVSVIPRSAMNKDLKIMSEGFPDLPNTSINAYRNSSDPHPLIDPFLDFLKEELICVGVG